MFPQTNELDDTELTCYYQFRSFLESYTIVRHGFGNNTELTTTTNIFFPIALHHMIGKRIDGIDGYKENRETKHTAVKSITSR